MVSTYFLVSLLPLRVITIECFSLWTITFHLQCISWIDRYLVHDNLQVKKCWKKMKIRIARFKDTMEIGKECEKSS